MVGYFDYSQQIKAEIENDPKMMGTLEEYFHKNVLPEHIGGHCNTDMYRVGKLASGMWVALRQSKVASSFRKERMSKKDFLFLCNLLETYADNMEKISLRGYSVPRFCIGVQGPTRLGLLVEDVTEGGKRPLCNPLNEKLTNDGEPLIIKNGEEIKNLIIAEYSKFRDTGEKIILDFDEFVKDFSSQRYMNTSFAINV